jgi:hypothetical protein
MKLAPKSRGSLRIRLTDFLRAMATRLHVPIKPPLPPPRGTSSRHLCGTQLDK